MNFKFILSIITATVALSACNNGCKCDCGCACTQKEAENDSTTTAKPSLVADSALTQTAKFYADKVDATAAYQRMALVDTIVKRDMSDMQKKCTYAFYPFGGPDFLFIHHLFPNADTYFLMGLEKPGTIANTPDQAKVAAYTQALSYYFGQSYYITKYMMTEMHNNNVDGVLPIITMLMAKDDCQIMSVKYKDFDAQGNIVDANVQKAPLAEVKFFTNAAPDKEKTLYFYSGNTQNEYFNAGLNAYLAKTLPKQKVGTFLKAASYLMHYSAFSTIRNFVLDNSFAVLQDDSGIPYKEFKPEKWNIQLYGTYKQPLKDFANCYQADLNMLYYQQRASVRPLNFRIGYNNPSNWMLARKK